MTAYESGLPHMHVNKHVKNAKLNLKTEQCDGFSFPALELS